ncbi:salivary glue protein Sgs-3-like [Dreissena polymorpha]|uniref:salivary glue protein Sgs-3-like n=1 Tax=Dreissena polymorpha TaxID=45954 RepID=UPI002263C310|nr:salivary glue protein Sgs-3-like [Dreissena polymorpha]
MHAHVFRFRYITKLHKANNNDVASFASHPELGKLDAIEIYSSFLVPVNVETGCSSNNGRGACSTFCHPTPGGYTCGCPDGEQLLYDGKTCPSGTTAVTTTSTTITTTLPLTTSSPTTVLSTTTQLTTVPSTTTRPSTVPPTTTQLTTVPPITTRPTTVPLKTTSTTRPTTIPPTTTKRTTVPPTTSSTSRPTTILPTTTGPATERPNTTTSSEPTDVQPTTATTSRHTTSNTETVLTISKSTIGLEKSNKADELENNIPEHSSPKAQFIGAAVGSALGIIAIAVFVRTVYTWLRCKVRWQIWRNNYREWQDSRTNLASDEYQSDQSSFEVKTCFL